MRRNALWMLFATAAAGVCAGLGSGTASAFAVAPGSDGGIEVDMSHDEAATFANLNLGPMFGQLAPNFTSRGKQVLGDSLTEASLDAANYPNATLRINVAGPLFAPSSVTTSVFEPY